MDSDLYFVGANKKNIVANTDQECEKLPVVDLGFLIKGGGRENGEVTLGLLRLNINV